jgi:F-type H+-transporting ATPase subunit delta
MLSALSTRYAKALVDVVTEPGSGVDPGRVLTELRQVQELLAGSSALRAALLSPAVSPSRKRNVMGKLMAPMGVHDKVRNFVFVLLDHRRVGELASIIEGFETLVDERLGYTRASISSARELAADQKATLEAQVTRLAGRKARVRFAIDPALIAGVVARVGSTVYDGSVRGQLEKLRMRLGRS